MQLSTRRVTFSLPRRFIGPACGLLLMMVCAVASAGDAPASGVRLPAGGILEQQDPRLADPVTGPARPAEAARPSISEEVQGPSSASMPSSAVPSAGTVAERIPESKQLLHRGGAPIGVVRTAEVASNTARPAAETWRVRDALPLIVVLALIAAVALVVRKYMPAKRMLTGGGAMDVVARLPLSGKQSLVLVKLGPRLVLVGVSPEQMASLAVIDDSEHVAAIIGRVAGNRTDSLSNSFAEALGDETHAYAEGAEGTDASSSAGGCVRQLLDKVRRLTRNAEVA